MHYHDPASYKNDKQTKKCPQCFGSGVYHGRGAFVNGKFVGYVGKCYACNGKGRQTRSDAYRNKAWCQHNLHRMV